MAWVPSNSRMNSIAATLVRALCPVRCPWPGVLMLTSASGPSSNIAFLRHISVALAQATGQRQVTEAPLNASNTTTDSMRASRPSGDKICNTFNRMDDKVNIHALPPETRIWKLINEYFQKTGQLLPIIHEGSFRETYFEMKRTNFTMARRTWLGLVNIILALGCTLIVDGYDTAEERIAESDVYFQRANGLCERESRRSISLELGERLPLTRDPVAWLRAQCR